jgi:putative ABC transport system permease protein
MKQLSCFREAFRSLWRTKNFSIISVGVLGIGVGASLAIFTVFDSLFLRPLPYPAWNNLFYVNERLGDFLTNQVPFQTYQTWSNNQLTIEKSAALLRDTFYINLDGQTIGVSGCYTTASYFDALRLKPIIGRYFSKSEENSDANRIVLSEKLWRYRFHSDPQITGLHMTLNGQPCEIVGVAPASLQDPEGIEVYAPIFAQPIVKRKVSMLPSNHIYFCIVRLRDNISRSQAEMELKLRIQNLNRSNPASDLATDVKLVSLLDENVTRYQTTVIVVASAVACLFLITCANVLNLFLTRFTSREKEIAIWEILGATRFRIFSRLTTEGFIISTFGATLGLGASILVLISVKQLTPNETQRFQQISLGINTFLALILVVMLLTLVFGTIPGILRIKKSYLSRSDHHTDSVNKTTVFLENAFVTFQILTAFVLTTLSLSLLKNFSELQKTPLGIDISQTVWASVSVHGPDGEASPSLRMKIANALIDRIKGIPGITAVAINQNPPFLGIGPKNPFGIVGQPDQNPVTSPIANWQSISPSYFRVMGISLRSGRIFNSGDNSNSRQVVIIDEMFVKKFFHGTNPIGRRIYSPVGTRPYNSWEIIGVVPSSRHDSLGSVEEIPQEYFPYLQISYSNFYILARSAVNPNSVKATLYRLVSEFNQECSINQADTYSNTIFSSQSIRRLSVTFVTLLSSQSLLLGGVGLYSILSYSISQKKHDIGVRMALGAQRKDIIVYILRQSIINLLIGSTLGACIAGLISKILKSVLMDVHAVDFATICSVFLLIFFITILGSIIPIIAAMRISPTEALIQRS